MLSLHLTEKFQAESADKLISKLKQQHAADEEYIAELENGISPKQEEEIKSLKKEKEDLENSFKSLKTQYAQLNTLYAQVLHNPELHIERYTSKIKELEEELKKAYKVRDELICRLNKQQNV